MVTVVKIATENCVRCGESHHSNECSYLPKSKDEKGKEVPDLSKKIPLNNVKCANCKKNGHTANWNGCSERRKYLDLQQSIRNKNTKRQANSYVRSILHDNTNFPPLPNNNNYTFSPSHHTASSWTKPGNSLFKPNETQNDLFTPDQCFQIMKKMMTKMSNCQSRFDQIQIIGEITFKYLNGSHA